MSRLAEDGGAPQVPHWARVDTGDGTGVAVEDTPPVGVGIVDSEQRAAAEPADPEQVTTPLLDLQGPDPVFTLDTPADAPDPVFTLGGFSEPSETTDAPPPPPPPPPLPVEPDFDLVEFGDDDAPIVDARWLWRLAVGLLVVASVVAVFLLAQRMVPPAVAGVGDGADWVATEVRDGTRDAEAAWDRWSSSLTDRAVAVANQEPAPVPAPEGSRSLLIAVSDADQRGVAYALLARSPSGEATLALVPPGLLAVQPGFGDFPLSEATLFADAELAALTLTNLLGVRIDDVLWLEQGELAEALGGEIELDLPVPLIVGEGDEGRVLAKSGRAGRQAAMIETIVATQGMSDQLEWMQRQGSAWTAILAAIESEPAIADALAAHATQPAEAVKLLSAATGDGAPTVTAIPVTQVSIGRGGDGYTLAGELADAFLEQRFGHLLLRPDGRPRVELLNGNGQVAATRLLAQELVRRGYRVIKTDNASNFDYETTQVISQGRAHRVDAQAVLDLLGSGELLLEVRAPSGVVDISIIVGQDIPAGR